MTDHPSALDKVDASHSLNRPLPTTVPVQEPRRDRKCTDVYCLVLFVFFNACLWTLSGWSYQEGDPQRLVHGWDLHGDFCGTGSLSAQPYTYFPVPTESVDFTICLPGCPVVSAESSVCLYDDNQDQMVDFGCYNSYPSRPFYNEYCLPAERVKREAVLTFLYSQDQVMTRVIGDIARAWDELAIAGVVTFGAMMVLLIAFKARFLNIPCFLLAFLVMLFLFAVLVYYLHEENWRVNGQICQPFGPVRMDQCDEGDTAHGYRDLAWTVASIGFCCGLVCLCMLPRLMKGERILRYSSKALGFHPLPWVCPCAGLILGTAFYAYFITLIIFSTSVGHHFDNENDQVPQASLYTWEFDSATRVLVFFDVGMILWWFSFIAHAVEYVIAATTAEWYLSGNHKDMMAHTRRAVHTLFRYHVGSVLLASVLIPSGRFLRNLFGGLKFIIRHCCTGCLGCSAILFKPCLASYDHWFKYMTSDCLAYMSIMGDSFLKSAKSGYYIVKRNDPQLKSQELLNSGNMVVWLFQLVIMLTGIVFCDFWIQNEEETFKDLASYKITSVTAMIIYEMFITWFFAQLYGAFVRGTMHVSIVAYLVDLEANEGGRLGGSSMALFLSGQRAPDVFSDADVKPKDGMSKVAPAPVVSEGLIAPETAHHPAEAHPATASHPATAAHPSTAAHPPVDEYQPADPPATQEHRRIETNQSVGDDVQLMGGEKHDPQVHT